MTIEAAYWPNAPEEEQAVAQPLNSLPKYVATRTLTDPLEWQNATVLPGDVAKAISALKQERQGSSRDRQRPIGADTDRA